MARKVRKQNCCIFIIKQNLIVAISDYSSYCLVECSLMLRFTVAIYKDEIRVSINNC